MLATAHRVLGRKVDVVGMDACLMTMIEVAYQLRDHAQVLVGSEEIEPGPGWPHAAILGDLTARPAMTAARAGRHRGAPATSSPTGTAGEIATQSAIDLGQLGDLVEAVDILAHRLLDELKRDGARRRAPPRARAARCSSSTACTWTCTTWRGTWPRPWARARSPTPARRSGG